MYLPDGDTATMKSSTPSLLSRERCVSHDQHCSTARVDDAAAFLQRAASMKATSSPSAHFQTQHEPSNAAKVEVGPLSSSFYATKRVHFGNFQSVITLPAIDDPTTISSYDQDEMAKRRASVQAIVDQHSVQKNPAYHDAILFLMKSFEAENQSREGLRERVRIVRATDVRGLEGRIVPLLRLHRSMRVREVLKLQKKLLHRSNIRPEMRAPMLRRKSLKLSREARQLAFRLAQADRLDAKESNGEIVDTATTATL